MQLIKEAKRLCPDVIIVLGEDLTRFRNASKELYAFLKSFSWNRKVERLGFDEVCISLLSHHLLSCLGYTATALFPSETFSASIFSTLAVHLLSVKWLGFHGRVRHHRV